MEEKSTSLVVYNSKIRKFFNDIIKKIKQALFKDPNGATFSRGGIFPEKFKKVIKDEYPNDSRTINMEDVITNTPELDTIDLEQGISKEIEENPKTPMKNEKIMSLQKVRAFVQQSGRYTGKNSKTVNSKDEKNI